MKALLVIDMQYDFLPGGSLGVTNGDLLIERINKASELFDICVYTKDWHPSDHCSFEIWPRHCVQYSHGAELSRDLIIREGSKIVYKGVKSHVDSYSAFFDNNKEFKTNLHEYLQSKGVDTVYVCGLAIEYCVKLTAMDAKDLGYKTYVLTDLTTGINANPGDGDKGLKEMAESGIILAESSILKQ